LKKALILSSTVITHLTWGRMLTPDYSHGTTRDGKKRKRILKALP